MGAREDAITAPLPVIEQALERAITIPRSTPALEAALRYGVLGGGKRLRPILAWHCCEAMGGRGEQSLVAGVALELVHCFSLVHDDLPALDNDDLRRGKPTLHKHAGEAMAILAGDAMLNLATEHVLGATSLDAATRVRLMSTLSRATTRMIVGQVADTLYDYPVGIAPGVARVRFVHGAKTGALLEAACVTGGLCAGRFDTREEACLQRFGSAIGLMFQAVDDLIDVTQSAQHAGKRTGKDAEAGKLTYPGVMGIEATRETIQELASEADAAIEPLRERGSVLREIARMMSGRTK
jgi:geranylgeranyl diphosphate synthase, type II